MYRIKSQFSIIVISLFLLNLFFAGRVLSDDATGSLRALALGENPLRGGGSAEMNADTFIQLEVLKQLLQSEAFALEISEGLDAAYQRSTGTPEDQIKPLVTPEVRGLIVSAYQKRMAGIALSDEEQKALKGAHDVIATSLPGLYALEAAISILGRHRNMTPLEVLDRVAQDDKQVLTELTALIRSMAPVAHATWETSTVWRSGDFARIHRDNFIPFDFLTQGEIEKDFVQLRNAAKIVRNRMAAVITDQDMPMARRAGLEQGIEALIGLIKEKSSLSKADEDNIRNTARIVMYAHRAQTRMQGTPYFVHQLAVATKLVNFFNITDPVMIQIALLHDTREDQEAMYRDMRALFRNKLAAQADLRLQENGYGVLDQVLLGVRLMSHEVNEAFDKQPHTDEERWNESLKLIIDPKSVYKPRPSSSGWYNSAYIRGIHLIKLCDMLDNAGDLGEIFKGERTLSEQEQAFPRRMLIKKFFGSYIPNFVEKSKDLTVQDKEFFYTELRLILEGYGVTPADERMSPLREAAAEALAQLPAFRPAVNAAALQIPGKIPQLAACQI